LSQAKIIYSACFHDFALGKATQLYESLHMCVATNFIIAILKIRVSCFSTALDALASAPSFLNKRKIMKSNLQGRDDSLLSRLFNVLINYIFLSENCML